MDEQMKSRLTSKDVWVRGLYMIFFAIAWGLSEILLTFSVIFQFLAVLFTGSANLPLLRFGQNLSRYHYQIAQFVSFNTEERPFPFSDWPEDEPGGAQWMGDGAPAEPVHDEQSGQPVATATEGEEPSGNQSEASEADPAVSESRKDEAPPPA